ncbi:MAG: NAD+ synthase [Gammaproteobacteria bacterium]|nr:NAD+ synthase [Gammaproteobacteria bacterium]
MSTRLRIALGQLNLMVGALESNVDRMLAAAVHARDKLSADLIVFPELAITGYPPEDLLLRPGFYTRAARALERMAESTQGIDVVVGHPWQQDGNHYNAASLLRDGKRVTTYFKMLLPNYGVFDEKRYFDSGQDPCVIEVKGLHLGLTICEDIWESAPVTKSVQAGARLILNLNASPFHIGKMQERERVVRDHVARHRVPLAYVNLVGGQDELVFDGGSFVMDASGEIVSRSESYGEQTSVIDVATDQSSTTIAGDIAPALSSDASIYQAVVLGVRDYVTKNGFPGVVLGLSGGVDSALTLAMAVDALGAQAVEAVMMPSRYTSSMSVEDAQSLAAALGVTSRTISIEPMYQAFLEALKPEFAGLPQDATEENIQARVRGIILMAISNKTGKMVLTTGNKSEMAVGYATLYGDMAGGFAAIKDLSKTMVYRLAAYRNALSPVIPERIITRPPSAELAENQKDQDTLPPYDILDPVLEAYIERDLCAQDIIDQGFPAEIVEKVVAMVDRNEYKRRQAAPGVRITKRAFGRDRRYPITSAFGKKNA